MVLKLSFADENDVKGLCKQDENDVKGLCKHVHRRHKLHACARWALGTNISTRLPSGHSAIALGPLNLASVPTPSLHPVPFSSSFPANISRLELESTTLYTPAPEHTKRVPSLVTQWLHMEDIVDRIGRPLFSLASGS